MKRSRAQFEELYTAHRNEVYRYLLLFGQPAPVAQEIAQEAFLRLYRKLVAEAPIANPRAWLFRVAHNLAVDELRRRDLASEVSAVDYLDRSSLETPEVAVLGKERTRGLLRVFVDLSPQQRACLYLRAEGLRYREIADVLGVGIATVGEHLQRAMKRMRAAIYE